MNYDVLKIWAILSLDLSDLSNLPISAIQNSARGTDGLTDRPSYRDAWTHLKTMYISHCSFVLLLSFSQSLHRAGLTFDKILRTKEQLGGRRSGVQGPELRDTLGHVRHIFCVCLTHTRQKQIISFRSLDSSAMEFPIYLKPARNE